MTKKKIVDMAKDHDIELELIKWYDKENDEIPERLRGRRKVIKAFSHKLMLECADKTISHLWFAPFQPVHCNEELLAIYDVGFIKISTTFFTSPLYHKNERK